MDTEKPHEDCSLSSAKRAEINVLTKPPSREARYEHRLDQARRRSGAPIKAAVDTLWHEAFRGSRGDGGDPADSPAKSRAHARSDRRPGRPSRLDRRADERGS